MKFKSLKRHLGSVHGLTPDQYRQKWFLPVTYPMVVPEYAAKRSALAKETGLGAAGRPKAAPEPQVLKGRGRPQKPA
jgi:predicted transcriptional regulator